MNTLLQRFRAWLLRRRVHAFAQAQLKNLDYEMLQAIQDLGPNATGPALHDHLRRRYGYDLSLRVLYSSLERLHVKGLADKYPGPPVLPLGGRRHAYYYLRWPGLQALNELPRHGR